MTRLLPPEPLDSQPREVDLLSPAQACLPFQEVAQLLHVKSPKLLGDARRRCERERLHRLVSRILLEIMMEKRQQRKHGNLAAIRSVRHMPRLWPEKHHVQHDVVVGRITCMGVSLPVLRAQMQLDVTDDLRSITDVKARHAEVRPAKQVPLSRVEYPDTPAIDRPRQLVLKRPFHPDSLKQFLRK